VSSSAIELDLLLAAAEDLAATTRALEQTLGPLLTVRELDLPPPQISPEEAIREGLRLFNEERYWESHESLESAWRKAEGAEKDVLQGLILIAAALVHLQKNKPEIALSVLGRAQEKLEGHQGNFFGVNLADLQQTISRMIGTQRPEFIKIRSNSHNS
jgi:hypothetical protein